MGLVNIFINNQGKKENSMYIKQTDAPKWAGGNERGSNGNEHTQLLNQGKWEACVRVIFTWNGGDVGGNGWEWL
jgi:hypothetical protein